MPRDEWIRERQYRRLTAAQVTVTTAATLIASSAASRLQADICMVGAQNVWIGTSAVTPATGALLTGTAGAALGIYTDGAIYGVSSVGTVAVSVLETFSS